MIYHLPLPYFSFSFFLILTFLQSDLRFFVQETFAFFYLDRRVNLCLVNNVILLNNSFRFDDKLMTSIQNYG